MAPNSSCRARAAPISLITASSAARSFEALERDHPDHAIPARDRDAEERLRVRTAKLDGAQGIRFVVGGDADRLSGLDDPGREALAKFDIGSLRLGASTLVDRIREANAVRRRVIQGHEHGQGIEDRSNSFADEVDDRLKVELFRQRLADLIDECQLGVPLPRLLDRANARESGADVLADVGQDIEVSRRVALIGAVRLTDDHADRPSLRRQRRAQPLALGEDADRLDLGRFD
jgi:hypothetical protein